MTSAEKVVSRLSDFGARSVVTSRSSRPFATTVLRNKPVAVPGAERPLEPRGRRLSQLAHRPDPHLGEALLRPWADPGQQRGRPLADGLQHPLRIENRQAVGLLQIGRDLRQQLVRRNADRAGEPRLVLHPALQVPGTRLRRR